MSKDNQVLANRSLGEILSSGFQLFGKTYIKIIGPFVLFSLISIILSIVLLAPLYAMSYEYYLSQQTFLDSYFSLDYITRYELSSHPVVIAYSMHFMLIGFLKGIIGGIFAALILCSVSGYLYNFYKKGDADFGMEFKLYLRNPGILKVILFGAGLSALYGASGLDLMAFFLLIPVILLFCYFIFMVYTYNMTDVKKTAEEARTIASGNSMRIIGVFVVAELISGLVQTVAFLIIPTFWSIGELDVLSWYAPTSFNFGMLLLNDIVINFVAILLAPLFICLLTPLFVSAKARKDIGYRYQREQNVSWGSSQRQQPARGGTRYKTTNEQYVPSRKQRPWEERASTSTSTSSSPKQRRGGVYCPFCGILISSPKKYCPGCGEEVNLN